MHLHGTYEIRCLQYLTFKYIHDVLRIFYENSCTIPTIKIFFLPCKAMKRMKYEKLLIQWTMHPHVKFEFRRLEYLIFIYIHDLLRFFLWKFLYFSYHKIFPSTLQSYELLNEVWKTTADMLQSDYLLLDFCDFAKKKKWQIALYD